MRTIAVIGLGRFGSALSAELQGRGAQVLAIDYDEEHLSNLRNDVSAVAKVNATDPEALRRLGVADVDVAVVAIGESFEATQECVLALRQAGARRIVARGQSTDQGRILKLIGADEVVSPEVESAKRVAHRMMSPLLMDSIELGDGIEIATITTPASLVGMTLGDVKPRSQHNILMLKIHRRSRNGDKPQTIVPPGAETVLEVDDQITFMGSSEDVRRFAAL